MIDSKTKNQKSKRHIKQYIKDDKKWHTWSHTPCATIEILKNPELGKPPSKRYR